jgi:hypothetical protein
MKHTTTTAPTIQRVKTDANGNGRFAVHFLAFLTSEESAAPWNPRDPHAKFNLAMNKARKHGGKRYRGADFAGGVVFQAHSEADVVASILALRNA